MTNSEIKIKAKIDSITNLRKFDFLDLCSLYQLTLKCTTKSFDPEDFPTTCFLRYTAIYFIKYLLLINLNKIGKRLPLISFLFLFAKDLIDIKLL